MKQDELAAQWEPVAEDVASGMAEWRCQHPKASFAEIEAALDERLAKLRARMLQDAALASRAAQLSTVDPADRPPCPDCGAPLEPRGQDTRQLTTTKEQRITLTRSYAVCPQCHRGLFPPG